MSKDKTFKQLSKEERIKIEVLLHQGYSLGKVASMLQRPVSTISREVKRNQAGHSYQAQRAEVLAHSRHVLKKKHSVFDHSMKEFIKVYLVAEKLSPELICVQGKRLIKDFISTEWIYQWIWKMKFSQKKDDRPYQGLFKYLRHASRKRKRGNKRHMRGNILNRVWIDQRPQEANDRSRMGDLECDIMLGKDRKPGLLVALDRKTRKTWIKKLKTKHSPYVIRLVKSIVNQCGAVRTLTFDNDQSFAEHYRLHDLGIKTFFTHPYSSQEKGSVENRIGLIRMFFPKQTEFEKISEKQIKKVENLINNRPLRMFNYNTPNQLYEKS